MEKSIEKKIVECLANGDTAEDMSKKIHYSQRRAYSKVSNAFNCNYKQLITYWRLSTVLDLVHNHGCSVVSAVPTAYKNSGTGAYYEEINSQGLKGNVKAQKLFLDAMMLYKEIADAGKPIPLKETSFPGRRHLIWLLRHKYNLRLLSKPGCGYFISLDQDDIRKCEMWIMRWRISAGVTPAYLKM